jgi:predicted transcriptional regulator
MPSPEKFIEGFLLKHSELPYDPVKAHEYYLRTRQLKGRVSGRLQEVTTGRERRVTTAPPKKSAAQLRAETKAKVEQLQNRLDKLKKVLRQLTEEAQARSGIKTQPAKKSPEKAGSGPKEKLTAKEKKEAAERSEKYRKEHPEKTTPAQEVKELQQKIQDVKEKIREMKEDLAAAREKAARRRRLKAVTTQ